MRFSCNLKQSRICKMKAPSPNNLLFQWQFIVVFSLLLEGSFRDYNIYCNFINDKNLYCNSPAELGLAGSWSTAEHRYLHCARWRESRLMGRRSSVVLKFSSITKIMRLPLKSGATLEKMSMLLNLTMPHQRNNCHTVFYWDADIAYIGTAIPKIRNA